MTAVRTALPRRLAVGPGPADVEPLCVRWPEHGEPEVSGGQGEVRRLLLRRLRGLRLELAADGALFACWGRGAGGTRWSGSWTPVGAGGGARDTVTVEVTASGGSDMWLDGWLVRSPAGTRLDALCLSPGNGGTWPSIVRVRTAMLPVASTGETAAAAGPVREPWGLGFAGTLVVEHPGGPQRGHPVAVAFGPRPRTCRATAAPAMALHSTDPASEGAIWWVAHCTDSAEFTAGGAGPGTRPGEYRLAVRYGPEHEDVGAPGWNVAPDLPAPADFALPMLAHTGRAELTLRGHRFTGALELTGTLELTGRHPFTGEPLTYQARLEAEESRAAGAEPAAEDRSAAGPSSPRAAPPEQPVPPPRELAGRWRALIGPLPGLDLGHDEFASGRERPGPYAWRPQAPDRAAAQDRTAFVRLFRPLDLAVGLVRDPAGDTSDEVPPQPVVLARATAPPTPPEIAAVRDDRTELRSMAERLTLHRRYVEARPLLSDALARYQEAAAAAGWPEQRRGEEIGVLRILDHQTLCDSALYDHRALVGRLAAAARLRGRLANGGPPGTGPAPYTGELVAGTLLAMLGQTHRLGYWRGMLGTDEERVEQVESVEPFYQQLVTVLLDLDQPVAALLAAEAGRARAFADLLGRAAPPLPVLRAARTDTESAPARDTALRPALAAATEAAAEATAHTAPGTAARPTARTVPDTSAPAAPDAHPRDRAAWAFGAPPPLNEARLERLLARHGCPVVAYFLTGDRLVRWIWTVGSGLTPHSQRVDGRTLAQMVGVVSRAGRSEGGAAPGHVREALRWLGELLWPGGPDGVEALLPADPDRPVTVVPHGLLSCVPFAALPDRAGRPLVHRHALSLLPGLSLLEGLLDRRDARRRAPVRTPRLLAFVDPEPMPAGLPSLTWTRTSFPLVAQWYGEGRSRVHSGTEATASRLAAEAAEASVLCLATHAKAYAQQQPAQQRPEPRTRARESAARGEADDGRAYDPMDSYVALARTPGHDGRLRARDLPDLRLGADLIILSACEGGSGRVTADGVIGLGRSFLVRGPTAVLLALSPVREEDSLDLVYRFHEHWLDEGDDRATALRRAQSAYAEMYPDAPERWAWFALLGLSDGPDGKAPPKTPY